MEEMLREKGHSPSMAACSLNQKPSPNRCSGLSQWLPYVSTADKHMGLPESSSWPEACGWVGSEVGHPVVGGPRKSEAYVIITVA